MTTKWLSILGLLVAVVLFFALNIFLGAAVRGARVDLTENKLYTLSAGSRSIAKSVGEPVKLTLYFSAKEAGDQPQMKSYGTRVRELLEEYGSISGGRIKVEVIDPEPFSDAEDRAAAAGVVPIPAGPAGERMYFGLVGTNSVDGQEVIPFFDPQNPRGEEFLEYDVSRLIYSLANPKKRVVGLISSLPIDGGFGGMDPRTGQPQMRPEWQVVRQLKELFNVKTLGADIREIPADVDVLMVVHPKNLKAPVLYAIDQYVMKGGRMIAFVDPVCEVDESGRDPRTGMPMGSRSSDLSALLGPWGVEMVDGKVAGDRKGAIQVRAGTQQKPEVVDYVCWIGLTDGNFDETDAAMKSISRMNTATPGVLRQAQGATTTFTPLIQTSADAMEIDSARLQYMPDPKGLLSSFVPGKEKLTLAARIGGGAKSAYPGGPPKDEAEKKDEPPKDDAAKAEEAKKAEELAAAHLAESKSPLNVIVVADADMLADDFWIRPERLGQLLLGYSKLADNGDFVIGAVDNLSGSGDLIGIRARGRYSRPFEKVEELRKQAEQSYRAEQEVLEEKLRNTESRLAELQKAKPAGGGQLIMTPEQQQEIDKFRQEMIATKKELRTVQHNLRKDIESMETRLKAINIAAIPAAVCLFAVGLGGYRAARRRSWRKKAG